MKAWFDAAAQTLLLHGHIRLLCDSLSSFLAALELLESFYARVFHGFPPAGRAEVELKVQRSLGDSQLEDSLSTTSLRLVLDGYSGGTD